MKFSTREDIDRPIVDVFSAMSNFERFETRIRDRGIPVERCAGPAPPQVGAAWQAPIEWRGRQYEVSASLVNFEADTCYAVDGSIGGVETMAVVDLVALARGKTRMFVSVELTPTSLSSRLMIQSLKLTKGSLNKRFKARVAALADEIRSGA